MSLETDGGIRFVSVRPSVCSQFSKSPYLVFFYGLGLQTTRAVSEHGFIILFVFPLLRKIFHIFFSSCYFLDHKSLLPRFLNSHFDGESLTPQNSPRCTFFP
jgi:hypothetical protein